MATNTYSFKTYEEVATYLLNQMAEEFGLQKVEDKQKIIGLRSGTVWEIDGKGIGDGNTKFVIIECKRYTASRLNQEIVGGLAYRINDTGASGGIIVSPLGLQEGAKKVAAAENIIPVIIDENSSSTDYIMKFLDKIKVGLSGQLDMSSSLGKLVSRKDGTIEDKGC
ncbi:MAG: hypothetical protein Q8O92_11740 [Candidatus Latescibacter sp.]|nr:hypothetical protein [Candidatus Latescibacter sp.]